MTDFPKAIRFTLWLAGTLVVGALGNGLWELAKPALLWISNGILDVATLGLTSLRDSMYIEIARGTYERAGEKLLSMALGLLTGVILSLIGAMWLLPRMKANAENKANRLLKSKRLEMAMLTMLAMLAITFVVQNFRTIYIVRAANHMEQIQKAVAPYISEQQRMLYASRFAIMRSRSEYLALMNEITKIAGDNKLHVPDFDVY